MIYECVRDMHFSMLAKKQHTVHYKGVKDYSATFQFFHLLIADGSAQE